MITKMTKITFNIDNYNISNVYGGQTQHPYPDSKENEDHLKNFLVFEGVYFSFTEEAKK